MTSTSDLTDSTRIILMLTEQQEYISINWTPAWRDGFPELFYYL